MEGYGGGWGVNTYMALEAGEVDVRDEEDGLRLQVAHRLEDGDVTSLV